MDIEKRIKAYTRELLVFLLGVTILMRVAGLLLFGIPFINECYTTSLDCNRNNTLCGCWLRDLSKIRDVDIHDYFESDTVYSEYNSRYSKI